MSLLYNTISYIRDLNVSHLKPKDLITKMFAIRSLQFRITTSKAVCFQYKGSSRQNQVNFGLKSK